MTEFVGKILDNQLFTRCKSRLVDKAPIALIQRKCFLGRDWACSITAPQQRLQLWELGRVNHRRDMCIHSVLNIVRNA